MSGPRVRSLHIYPVKSMRGMTVTSATLDESGFEYDRRWMMVDEQGRFLTQRELPAMARMHTELNDAHLMLRFDEMSEHRVPLQSEQNRIRMVEIWGDGCTAIDEGPDVAHFLSMCFSRPCRLVRLPTKRDRLLDSRYTQQLNRSVAMHFGDSQPLHIVNVASWAELNARMDQSVPIDRFRANIVVEGLDAWQEDDVESWTIGTEHFLQTKSTSRCVVTTINQQDGTSGTEPLRTLAQTRSVNNRVLFGIYVVHASVGGKLHAGDTVRVALKELT